MTKDEAIESFVAMVGDRFPVSEVPYRFSEITDHCGNAASKLWWLGKWLRGYDGERASDARRLALVVESIAETLTFASPEQKEILDGWVSRFLPTVESVARIGEQ